MKTERVRAQRVSIRRAQRRMNMVWMMEEFGMSQADVARELGVSHSTVSQMGSQVRWYRMKAHTARKHGEEFDEAHCYIPRWRAWRQE